MTVKEYLFGGELLLRGFAGQYCDVQINWRKDGTCYVTFLSQPGYGFPTLEISQLSKLIDYSTRYQ